MLNTLNAQNALTKKIAYFIVKSYKPDFLDAKKIPRFSQLCSCAAIVYYVFSRDNAPCKKNST